MSVALSNLAGVLTERGAVGEADTLYRQGLALRHRLTGGDHPDLALDRAGYARLLHLRGDLAESERLYRQALAVQERALPRSTRRRPRRAPA